MSCRRQKEEFNASLDRIRKETEIQRVAFQSVLLDNSASRREELILKIQNFILKTVKCAANDEIPSIKVNRRFQWKDSEFNERLSLKPRNETSCQHIKFTSHERRFVIICCLLRSIHRLLLSRSSVTKRELYYERTELFGSQTSVNTAVLDICDLLHALLC
ncbi:meiotic recombination protein SPO11-like [Macrosteles quadrilineatus]|uniref:meiotic recombination protein SPO11-like n=1 Tax=Macrosteles quadrilineatus TaxID=74068 RepID=UPI0023E0DDFF|nr:meiotic recombination protein SPO11-like [Macrosteles quadrilineatus]